MRSFVFMLAVLSVISVVLFSVGCSTPQESDDNDTTPSDSTEVPDTTQPDSTGVGTMSLVSEFYPGVMPSLVKKTDSLLIVATQPGPYGGSYAVNVYSISNPESPTLLSTYPDGSFPAAVMGMDILGNVLFVISLNKLYAIDISDSSPQLLGQLSLSAQPQCIAAGDGAVFLGYLSLNGEVVDISNYAEMSVIATIPVFFTSCDYSYDMLYCASASSPIYAVDVSSPSAPQIVATGYTGGQNLDIVATPWGFIYVAGGAISGTNNAIFATFRSSNITTTVRSDTVENLSASKVAYQDNFAYLIFRPQASSSYSLRTYFAYRLESLQLAFSPETVIYASDICAGNGYIYVAARGISNEGVIYIFRHDY